jgi:hypothetical protein
MEIPRFLLFSPWTVALSFGAVLGALIELGDGWGFLEAFHPIVLGVVAAGLTLWVLFALVPKITVHAMRGLDLKLPRGDSAVPAVGTFMRFITVILGPTLIYLSLMALREEPGKGWEVAGAALIGLVLGALVWRTVTLLGIMRENFPEDEIRKGLLDTGAYPEEAIAKLERAAQEIVADGNFDRKRIRLRRLAATDRVLRNKNYDPHQFEHGTTASATIGGLEREGSVRRARRVRDQVDREADFTDSELDAKISEQRARQRQFESMHQSRRARRGMSLDEELENEAEAELSLYEAGDKLVARKVKEWQESGLPPEEVERRKAVLEAKLAEIIARKLGEE